MKQVRIALDVDGVLANFREHLLREVSEKFDTPVEYLRAAPRQGWDLFPALAEHLQVPVEELYNITQAPGFCARMPEYPAASSLVSALRALPGADIVIVTSAWITRTWHHERLNWLYERFNVLAKDVIFANRKELVMAHVLIDDHPKHVYAWRSYMHHETTHSPLPVLVQLAGEEAPGEITKAEKAYPNGAPVRIVRSHSEVLSAVMEFVGAPT